MPHPGLRVCTSPEFDGKLKDVEKDFKYNVQKFVENIFAQPVSCKEIYGQPITAYELFQYFKVIFFLFFKTRFFVFFFDFQEYCRVFEAGELPEPKSMLIATAEANNLASKAVAKEFYIHAMEQYCGGDRPYMHPHHLQAAHEQIKEESLNKFKSTRKMGGESLSVRYLEELIKEIEDLYVSYVKHNDSKNIFAFSRTATSLIAVMFITYLSSGILEWFWLGSFSFLLNFVFWSCFVLLFAWVYVKYSGEYKEIGEYIDSLADILWRKVGLFLFL